jgi:hypothetical protein
LNIIYLMAKELAIPPVSAHENAQAADRAGTMDAE